MAKSDPIPQGKYVPAVKRNGFIFTAGMTPRKNGVLMMSGKVRADDDLETYRDAIRQAAENALTAAKNQLAESEKIGQVMSVTVFVNAEPGFVRHSVFADYASEYLVEELGGRGVGARAAVGMSSLPGDAPCEISIICTAE